jgi:hypothetical protein
VEIRPGAGTLDLQVSAARRVAFPYSRLLSCEWVDGDGENSNESLSIRFPKCEVRVVGRGLKNILEPLQSFQVARLAVIDPCRVFEAGFTVIETITIPVLDY